MNISDFLFASQYLVNSLQFGGTFNVTKTTFALYGWLLGITAFIVGCEIYLSLVLEHFVDKNSEWASIFCALLENQ
jgi:hypothetical protein